MWLLRLAWLPAAVASLEGPEDAVALLQQPFAMRHFMETYAMMPRMLHLPVMWVHLPQAGAEPMCELAKANGEKFMYTTDMNTCNWLPYDDYRVTPPTPLPDCYSRQQTWLAGAFSWSQIERPFREEDYCKDWFWYGTIIGDPVKLVKSRLASNPDSIKIVDCLEARKNGDSTACANTFLSPAAEGTWKYFDNPQVRMLGGPEVWALPPGAVNTTHTRAALNVMKSFDLVLVADRMGLDVTKDKLRAAFHWNNLNTSDVFASQVQLHRVDLKDYDIARIQRQNEHDKLLYDVQFADAELNDLNPFTSVLHAVYDDY